MKTQVDELARSWSREDLTTVHNAVLQDPQQFSQLLATIISERDADVFMPAASFTEGTGHRDELGPVAPVKPIQLDVILKKKNKKPLRLLTGIPLSLGKQVQKAAWVYDAVNTIIGVYESAESSAATLSNKPQKMTLKSGNKVLAPTQDLLALTGSKILCLEMHLGPAVPMPQKKKNDWKVGPATKDLSVERTHEVHANADQHCVLSGSFCFRGQAGHECAHIIPRACDTDALRKFVGAMSKIDTTFPLLTSLNDARNIILVDIRQHRALDREAIAAYLPPPTRSPAPSDGLVTTVEWHHWPSDKSQTGHANHLDAWAEKLNGLRDEGKSKEPGIPHKCDAHPAFASWYTATEPWTETATFPHPTLLRLHYGVFLAHKFGSLELKSFAMGGKRRKWGGGGKDRGGHDSKDNEDENLNTVIRRAPVHA
ncbi:hypothetical protein C8R43DRAFT_1043603 [Mycena crocata]|nr:hypothetical protein C8R43DRAFT_1043603 [Mycena crocata]